MRQVRPELLRRDGAMDQGTCRVVFRAMRPRGFILAVRLESCPAVAEELRVRQAAVTAARRRGGKRKAQATRAAKRWLGRTS